MGLHGALGVAPLPGTPPVGMSATDMRLALAGIFGVTPQLVSGGGIAQSGSNMNFTVAQSVFQLADVTNAAATTFLPTDSTILTPAAGPGTGSRIDLICIPFKNWENGDASSQSQPTLVAGTAGTPGVAPAVPAGSYQYASILVPTSAATAAACTVTLASQTTFAPPDLLATTLAILNTKTGIAGQQATVTADGNNNGLYQYFGGWQRAGGASGLIIPTVSGAGVSVDSTGLVTWSAATVITVDTCFPTTFRKHKVSVQTINNTGTGVFIFRTPAPADDATARYDFSSLLGQANAAASATVPSGISWPVALRATALVEAEFEFIGAPLAQPTTGFLKLGAHSNPAVANANDALGEYYITQQESVAFGGLKITFTAACSGSLRITGEY